MMEAACPQAVSARLANPDGGAPPPSTLFSWESFMTTRRVNKTMKMARWDARSFARRLASLACLASVHGVPAPPLPGWDFLRSLPCQRGWHNKSDENGHR